MTDIWTEFIATARAILPGHLIPLYFDRLELRSSQQDVLLVACPNEFIRQRLNELCRRYQLLEVFRTNISAECKRIDFIVDPMLKPLIRKNEQTELALTVRPETPFKPTVGIRPEHRRENLIVHPGNNEANGLLEEAVRSGGLVCLFGPPGSGLTHLVHAFGHLLGERFGADKVRLISAAAFQDLVVSAYRPGTSKNRPDPRSLFAPLQALIVEDLQYLTGPRSGKELALVIKAVLARQGCVFLTADAPPQDLPVKSPELKQALADAYLANVSPASDKEAKTAIVASIVGQNGFRDSFVIDAETMAFLVDRLPENTRAIRGILNNLLVRSKLHRTAIDHDLVRSLLRQHGYGYAASGIEQLFNTVCAEFGIAAKEVLSTSRQAKLVEARKFFAHLAHAELGTSAKEIGTYLKRNRTTVLFYLSEMDKDLANQEAARIKKDHILRTFHSK